MIARLVPGNPPTLNGIGKFPLAPAPGAAGLFEIDAAACGLQDGAVYHYWFEVDDSRSAQNAPARIAVTDPFATSVDWRVFPPKVTANNQPASVIRYLGQGKLADSDPGGEAALFAVADMPNRLTPNNQIVIYELPTAWALSRSLKRARARRRPPLSMWRRWSTTRSAAPTFADLSMLNAGHAYLVDLGVNALELLPPADSFLQTRVGLRHLALPRARLRARLPRGQPVADRQPRPGPPRRCLPPQGHSLFHRRRDGLRQGGTLQPHRRAQISASTTQRPTRTTPTR